MAIDICGDSLFQQHLFRGACPSVAIANCCNRPKPYSNNSCFCGHTSFATNLLFDTLIYGNNSPKVVTKKSQHTGFRGDRYLSQQPTCLWREAITTIQMICGERPVSTRLNFVVPSAYRNGQNVCGKKLLRQ